MAQTQQTSAPAPAETAPQPTPKPTPEASLSERAAQLERAMDAHVARLGLK